MPKAQAPGGGPRHHSCVCLCSGQQAPCGQTTFDQPSELHVWFLVGSVCFLCCQRRFSTSFLSSCHGTAFSVNFFSRRSCLKDWYASFPILWASRRSLATFGGATVDVDRLTNSSLSGLKGLNQLVSINWTKDCTSASSLRILGRCRSGWLTCSHYDQPCTLAAWRTCSCTLTSSNIWYMLHVWGWILCSSRCLCVFVDSFLYCLIYRFSPKWITTANLNWEATLLEVYTSGWSIGNRDIVA